MKSRLSLITVLPVLFGFFVMGFVDVVGIATSYIKQDFTLSDTYANLIPLCCFVWFFLFSLPAGMLMNRIGRKNCVLLSYILQGAGLLLPVWIYTFPALLVAFALIGIGNTVLQVSLNPLVTNVVPTERLTSTLTFGVFIKAVASFSGPILAAWAAGAAAGWQLIFPIYALCSLGATLWLSFTPIPHEQRAAKSSSFGAVFALLRNRRLLLFFGAILVLVGVDVGANTTFPKYVMERTGTSLANAGYINSIYFLFRSLGAFAGAILLMRFPVERFYRYSVWVGLAGLVGMLFAPNLPTLWGCAVLFGLGYANLFSIVFSLSLQEEPQRANEISALLITGVAGGALLPPLLGIVSDCFDQRAAMLTLALVWLYLGLLFPQVRRYGK